MQTCSLNVFKLKGENTIDSINESIIKKLENNTNDYNKSEKTISNSWATYNFYFYFGIKANNNCSIDWYDKVRREFNNLPDESKNVCSTYGVLIIDAEIRKANTETRKIEFDRNVKYAITFGHGSSLIMDLCDYNYGLEMAGKMANEASIKTQSSKYYSSSKNKSLTLYNNANFFTEVGEAIDILTAEIVEQSKHTSVTNLLKYINKDVMFSIYLKLSLIVDFSLENIIEIIQSLDYIRNNYREDVLMIPKLSKLSPTKDFELIKKLNERLKQEALKEKENISFSFGMYKNIAGSIFIISDIDEVTISCRAKKEVYKELSVENVIDFMKKYDILDITSLKINIGNKGAESIINYLDFTVQLDEDDTYYCLESGKWAKFNKIYVDKVEKDIKTKIKDITEFKKEYKIENLESLRTKYSKELIGEDYDGSESMKKKLYKERVYNCHLSHELNGELIDRKTIETDGIEIADIYTRDTHELIHVKIGNPGVFIECINQSANGAHYYKHHTRKVKKVFENKIGEVDTVTMLLVTDNTKVLKSKDISKFNSLRFKINLLQWFKQVDELNLKKRIIIVPA